MKSFTLAFVPVMMVFGLITPIVGPAIDHHYADRSPVHTHAFIGELTNTHDHSDALSAHIHSSGTTSDGVSVATGSATTVHGPLTLDGATFESFTPVFDGRMIAVHGGESFHQESEAIAPPDRPPRLS